MIALLLILFPLLFLSRCGCEQTCLNNLKYDELWTNYEEEVDKTINRAGGTSLQCRDKIRREFDEYKHNLQSGNDPDGHLMFRSQCTNTTDIEAFNFTKEGNISYIILAHTDLGMVTRIINILNDSFVFFVVHVDLKSPVLHDELENIYGKWETNVYLLPIPLRQTMTWGGFSIVNATIQCYKFALSLNRPFDWIVELSGSHYPLQNSQYIQEQLIKSESLAFMNINLKPFRPETFYHFLECEGSLFLIRPKTVDIGMHQYIGSQYKIIHRHIAVWLTTDALPIAYTYYARHVIISDENYFSTVLMGSPYCNMIENKSNYLFVIFEPFKNTTLESIDTKKCLIPGVQCGRSPTVLEFNSTSGSMLVRLLERNDNRYFFARKFGSNYPKSLLLADYIDRERHRK